MHNNIAIELLKTLDKDELKRFESFIKSPFHNTNKIIVTIFDLIKKYAPEYEDKALHREQLFKKLYPGKSFSETSLRTRMSELTELIKKYFSFSHFEKDEFHSKLNIISELKIRKKYKLAEKYILEMMQKIENKRDAEIDYYEKLNLVKELIDVYRISKMKNYSKYSIELGDSLFNFFYRELFVAVNEISYEKEVFNFKSDYEVTEEFLKTFDVKNFLNKAKEKKYTHYPYLALFYYMYIARTDYGNEENFFNLKELTYEYHTNLSRLEKFNIWTALVNAINGGLRFKDIKYIREAFELNRFFLELNIMPLEKGGYFYTSKFENIFTVAITCKEFDFAEKFAEENYKKLSPDEQENTINFCRAILQFYNKSYEKSLSTLNKVELSDVVIKMRVRMYYFMNYYETNSFESVNSLIDSFKHFLSENKDIPDMLANRAKLALYFAAKITAAKINNKKLDYAVYKEAKDEHANFWSKDWFIEKMEELI